MEFKIVINNKIALVTGGNNGIGLEICRQLAQRDITVVLTARSHEKGLQACESLKKEKNQWSSTDSSM